MIELLRALTERAALGEITGLIYVAAVAEGNNEIGLCGDFAEDADFAARAARDGFKALVNFQGHIQTPRRLPRDLVRAP